MDYMQNHLPPKQVRLAEKQKKYEEELISYYKTLESAQQQMLESEIGIPRSVKPRKKGNC
jgi:hypothetical protein